MRIHPKLSTASRTTVRSLIVACMPTVVVALIANPPALGAASDKVSDTGANTNAPPAKGTSPKGGGETNRIEPIIVDGQRG